MRAIDTSTASVSVREHVMRPPTINDGKRCYDNTFDGNVVTTHISANVTSNCCFCGEGARRLVNPIDRVKERTHRSGGVNMGRTF